MTRAGEEAGPGSMQSLDRTLAVLRAVAAAGPHGARLAEVSAASGLSRSTAHRFLGALAQAGLLESDGAVFHLGLALCSLGAAAANRYELRDLALPAMQRLAARTGDTVYLSLRDGAAAVCVERIEGAFPIRTLTLDVGDRRPLGVGAGSLALLAFRPDAEVEATLAALGPALAAYPAFDAAVLRDLVAETRWQGHAFNDQRVVEGMSAVGVPLVGADGAAVAALSVAAISSRLAGDRRADVVAWTAEAAAAMRDRLAEVIGPPAEHRVRALERRRVPR